MPTDSLPLLLPFTLGAILVGIGLSVTAVGQRRGLGWALIFLGAFAVIGLAPRLGPRNGPAAPTLRVASVLDRETTDALVKAFERDTGIVCEVDAFAGGTQTTLDLILQERIVPDVLLGGTGELHEILADAGKLRPYIPLPDPDRITRYDDPRHHWVPIYLGYLAIVYRPLPSLQAKEPDFSTLVEPAWAGRVTIPSPSKSGGGFVFLATQLQRFGSEAAGWNYLQLLLQRGVRFEARSSLPITQVGSGVMDLGVAWAHDIHRRMEDERLPVALTIPDQTGYEVGGVSILAASDRAEVAEDFVQFLTSSAAAEIQVRHGRRAPLRADVQPPDYLRREPPDVDAYDRAVVLRERERWLQRWWDLSEGAR